MSGVERNSAILQRKKLIHLSLRVEDNTDKANLFKYFMNVIINSNLTAVKCLNLNVLFKLRCYLLLSYILKQKLIFSLKECFEI